MNDDEILGGILRRFLSDGEYRFYFIHEDHLTLDAKVAINEVEVRALLRATGGQLDGPGLAGHADAEWLA